VYHRVLDEANDNEVQMARQLAHTNSILTTYNNYYINSIDMVENVDLKQSEPKRQTNFLLPESLVRELRRLVPPKKRSQVVAIALERELARIKLRSALGEYFGAWKPQEA